MYIPKCQFITSWMYHHCRNFSLLIKSKPCLHMHEHASKEICRAHLWIKVKNQCHRLLWFSPGRQLSTTQSFTDSHQVIWGRESGGTSTRTHGSRWSLLCKEKHLHTREAKQGINILLPSAARCSATSRNVGFILCHGLLGRQMPSLQMSPSFSFFTSTFIGEHNTVWHGLYHWPVWAGCPGCIPI